MDFFCDQVISGKLPVQTLYVSKRVIAYLHTAPEYEEHVLVIPRKHISSLTSAARADEAILMELLGVVARMARELEDRWGSCEIHSSVGDSQAIPHLSFSVYAGARLPSG